MPRVSQAYGLAQTQANLDFVDVELSTDTALYLDPYAIQIRHDDWSDKCGDHIRSFFGHLLDSLRGNNTARATHLLSHLHEPNETYLGVSSFNPSGRGIGPHKAAMLAGALVRSRAFQTGMLTDISEAELFVRGIGHDTISDLTTNVVRGILVEYTTEQCRLHSMPMQPVAGLGPIWNVNTADWEARPIVLPVFGRKPILLVPKFSIRRRLSLDSQEFWNHHMIEFLQAEYLTAEAGLVQVLRGGRRRVTKKSVKDRHPLIKDDLADFVRHHPEILEEYKRIKGAQGALLSTDMDKDFDERAFAEALRRHFGNIPEGPAGATDYHTFMVGLCTFLFYPHLIYPIKEQEIHDGRKRVDIKFTNTSEGGFFQRMAQSPQARALSVLMECKNYERSINNPELDQLSGRFGHQRGYFGMLLCRRMDERQRIVERCRDAANDGRGYMLALEDGDFIAMLTMVEGGQRERVDRFLQERFDEITH